MRLGKGDESLEWAESRMRQCEYFPARGGAASWASPCCVFANGGNLKKFVYQHLSYAYAIKVIIAKVVLSLHGDMQTNSSREGKNVQYNLYE
ncbi:hypothetical protein E2C01_096819 [Portunus trituberculatus]|uniref:Uncharacterized protein n=1 Tax=Portunus trituberculatus TaxID=210409 RepID=A0A5B7K8A3_PORTR|nr:hypothetical protein [Portunus trituberculatus]